MYYVTHETPAGSIVLDMALTNEDCRKKAERERDAFSGTADIKERDGLANVQWGGVRPIQNGDAALAAQVAHDLALLLQVERDGWHEARGRLDAIYAALSYSQADAKALGGSPFAESRTAIRYLVAFENGRDATDLNCLLDSIVALDREAVIRANGEREATAREHAANAKLLDMAAELETLRDANSALRGEVETLHRLKDAAVRGNNSYAAELEAAQNQIRDLSNDLGQAYLDKTEYRQQRDSEGARAVKAEREAEALCSEMCNVAGIVDLLLGAVGAMPYGAGRAYPEVMAVGRLFLDRGAELQSFVAARL